MWVCGLTDDLVYPVLWSTMPIRLTSHQPHIRPFVDQRKGRHPLIVLTCDDVLEMIPEHDIDKLIPAQPGRIQFLPV